MCKFIYFIIFLFIIQRAGTPNLFSGFDTSQLIIKGVRQFVPDELVFDDLDYLFAVGDWDWGFWILG